MKDLKTFAILCLASLVVCSPRATARAEGHNQSGIAGQVVWATWSPEMQTPVQCFVSIVSDSGKTTATVQTDANGVFRIALKPGTYSVTPFWSQPEPITFAGPTQRVTVQKKDYTAVMMPFTFFDEWGGLEDWSAGGDGWIEPWLP